MGTKQRTGNEVTDRAKVSNNYNNISVRLGTFMHSDTYRLSTRNVLQNSTFAARYLGAKA